MSLSKEELVGARVERVEIAYAPTAVIRWEEAEIEYAQKRDESAGVKKKAWRHRTEEEANAEREEVRSSPESEAYIRDKLGKLIQEKLNAKLSPRFQGSRGVVVHVTVHAFDIPSAARRVVLGGSPMIGAVTVLKDAKTGVELAKMDRLAAGYAGNGLLGVAVDQGFSDMHDRALEAYSTQVLDWMKAA
ncbi:MAG: hypothetical protein NW215_06855 [Hyphomicrobiales bacterium]|nr:hypothetical protein [Hyphomicrobiales bacterium]